MRIVKVFRPESAVSDPDAIESMRSIPLINDHEMLSGAEDGQDTAPEDYGVSGIITENVYYDAPWMRGDLKVFARDLQADINAGKEDLSLGYGCEYHIKSGEWNGQPYEVIQTRMRGNHIALVKEGRVSGAKVLDGLCFDHLNFDIKPSKEGTSMAGKTGVKTNGSKATLSKVARDSAVGDLQALIPQLTAALQAVLNEGASEPENDPDAQTPNTGEENVNDDVVTDPVADPVVDPVNDPDADAGGDVTALIEQAKAILAKLTAATQGSGEAVNEPESEANDNIEGLTENSEKGAKVATDADPKAPSEQESEAASAKAQDAALGRFYADLAAKDSIYKRLSSVVGAFDHKAMDSRQVAVYGVKKLGIKCEPGTEMFAMDAYLSGVEKAQKDAVVTKTKNVGLDSAAHASPELDAYLQGSN